MSALASIVQANQADLQAIKFLVEELNNTLDDKEDIDLNKALENCNTLIEKADSYIFVAKINSCIAGFINFNIRKTIIHAKPSGLIDELIVSEKHRGKNIGGQLINAAIEKCRQLGCCEVEVSTEKTNTKAREFYRKCGFNENAVFMELELP